MNRTALRAAALIAAVYGHFLIFAQFSFVELLRAAGVGVGLERATLGAMAVAGVAGGFWVAWRGASPAMIRVALFAAGASAGLAPLVVGAVSGMMVAVVTGGALGVATVGVSALVRGWCGMAWVGLGTGLGYAVCNVPWVFTQVPSGQAWIGAALAVVGGLVVPTGGKWRAEAETSVLPWGAVVVMFAALVWLDSAAFFIIQHVADLKAGTWGEGMHWRNAGIHLGVAIWAGWWMARGGAKRVPLLAWVLLAIAAVAVNSAGSASLAGWLYPAGVSLYSTALVIWPSWLGGAMDERKAGWRAAGLFALAGWFASANGIGMAESLRRVPEWFVVLSGCAVIVATVFSNRGGVRALFGVVIVLMAVVIGSIGRGKPEPASAVARGRQVYLSEGCIHCHSQYLRPGSLDEELWGKAGKLEEVRKGVPVLIGNRRQGPDLATVGARRSAAWLREHFMDPQMLVPGSSMPSYAGLFNDRRGADLVAYLQAAATEWSGEKVTNAADWRPEKGREEIDPEHGKKMFAKWCVACHGVEGRGDGPLAKRLAKPPVNLVAGPFLWTAAADQIELNTARVIKFGLLGTDMPGHEVLTDAQVMDLTAYVLGLRAAAK